MPPETDDDKVAAQFGGRPLSDDEVDRIAARLGGQPSSSDTIGPTPWYDKPWWSFETEMAVGQEGPTTRGLIDALPSIGGAAGGIIHGGAGLPTGPGAVLSATTGAALWGAFGEAARQGLRRLIGAPAPESSQEAATAIGSEALMQGGSELLGQGVGRLVKGVVSPGLGAVDEAGERALERLGNPEVPASWRVRSPVVQGLEANAAQGPGGSGAVRRAENAIKQMTAIGDQVVARASTAQDDAARGALLANGYENFVTNWKRTEKGLYEEFERVFPRFQATFPDTLGVLEPMAREVRSARKVMTRGPIKDENFYQGLISGLTEVVERPAGTRPARDLMGIAREEAVTKKVRQPKAVNAQNVRDVISKLDEMIDKAWADDWAKANLQRLKAIRGTLKREFMAHLDSMSPEAASKLAAADATYAAGKEKIEKAFGRTFFTLMEKGDYAGLAKAVANTRLSESMVPTVFGVVGPEGADAIRGAVLADLMDKATSKDVAGRMGLTPAGLAGAMKRYGHDKLRSILTAEQYQRMSDIATVMKNSEGGAKLISGSPTPMRARLMAYPAAGVGAMMGEPWALTLILGDAAFSRFVATPMGQRWLTTGFPAAAGAVGFAGRQAPRGLYQAAMSSEE